MYTYTCSECGKVIICLASAYVGANGTKQCSLKCRRANIRKAKAAKN